MKKIRAHYLFVRGPSAASFSELQVLGILVYSHSAQWLVSSPSLDKFSQRDQNIFGDNFIVLNTLARFVWYGGFTNGTPQSFNGTGNSSVGKLFSSRNTAPGRILFERGSFGVNEVMHSSMVLQDFIKWSRELVNTGPDYFELSKEEDDSGAILIQTTGVYEISFTFFVPPEIHKPTVQLRINGRPVLSTIDNQQNAIYHQDQMRHVSVITYHHVIAEPSKLQLSFSPTSAGQTSYQMLDYAYSPDSVKGFIQIKKL